MKEFKTQGALHGADFYPIRYIDYVVQFAFSVAGCATSIK
jgi:hypothetical protein